MDDYYIDVMVVYFVCCVVDFDVIVIENMYGDIFLDLVGEFVGSLGLVFFFNVNEYIVMV